MAAAIVAAMVLTVLLPKEVRAGPPWLLPGLEGLLLLGLIVGDPGKIDGRSFSLVYWELDEGGPAARFFGDRRQPDLAFPQELNPEIARDGWRPFYIDYLYLAYTNATAFSPTDAMPLVPWSKIAMML